ncbi:hypothetical protein C8Q77DRAFT_1100209 [Trametes polyzona]|nr:hypothetical protein C8Q77DRAFT_1100209 [Trametes polyzona]
MATVSASQPSRMPSPEIIDVDALEEDGIVYSGFHARNPTPHRPRNAGNSSSVPDSGDDEVTFTGFRRRSRRRALHQSGSAQAGPSAGPSGHNVISLDSDDEVSSSSTSIHRRQSGGGTRSRLLSPPPPAPLRGHTPGVPPLPRHLSAQASLPRRRAQNIPPPIRPHRSALAFELPPPPLPRLPPRNVAAAPAAAPRSHHQPAMGLGGALIALNRQEAAREANRANRNAGQPRGGGFNLPSFTDMLRRMTGFGGGAEEAYVPARPEGNLRSWRNRLFPWHWDDVAFDAGHDELFGSEGDVDPLFGLPEIFDVHRPNVLRYPPPADKVPMWKPEYTHPYKPAPGFTNDFAAPDEEASGSASSQGIIVLDEDDAGPSGGTASGSSSATAVETTLVCARCLDPLVLAPAERTSEEDAKMRRVWALRCGHMLDGKCVMEFMSPPEARSNPVPTPAEPPAEDTTPSSRGKGKGKAREEPEPTAIAVDAEMETTPSATLDRKGKRKAVEPLEPEEPAKRPALAEPASADMDVDADNSIRSRLRSRARAAVAAATADVSPPSASAPGPAVVAEGNPSSSAPRRERRRPPGAPRQDSAGEDAGYEPERAAGKGKGKGKAKVERKPAVEAEHEWRCPVAGCGCVHYSVRVEGTWTNDEGRGPIGLFV